MAEPSWHDLQYLPSLTVKDASGVVPAWWKRAAATRQRYTCSGDIKYGAHPREVLDLFPALNPRGTVVYIHGGYWRSFSKLETSFVAEGFLQQGYSVALINYPLCPDVSLAHIRTSVIRAFAHLYSQVLSEPEKRRVAVTGHSAGGHLAALHLTVDWRKLNLPENPMCCVLPISGIFDVEPLILTSLNPTLRLTVETARPLNLMQAIPRTHAKLMFAVGADEPSEFHRQSHDQARAWPGLKPRVEGLSGMNHFTIVDSLADPQGQLNRWIVNTLAS